MAIALCGSSLACNTLLNGWLDLTPVGAFDRTATTEIRASLTLEDTPRGIPGAVYPCPEDSEIVVHEYPISPGDTLAIEINELVRRLEVHQAQAVVSYTGYVNLPIIGRIRAEGLTVPDFEAALVTVLRERDVLVEPEVTVNPLFLQNATYSIFGIGVSAATDAPLRAGTFPIRRPDLTILEAINLVGGLNEFVTDVYIFRYDEPAFEAETSGLPVDGVGVAPGDAGEVLEQSASGLQASHEPATDAVDSPSREQEVFEAAIAIGTDRKRREIPDEDAELLEVLEPEAPQPYLFINGEFVPNPTYKEATVARDAIRATAPSLDSATPAVNWARIAGETTYRILEIPADSLRSGDPEANIYVRPGDMIRIVSGEIGVYYVMGQVNRVGAFAFNTEPITLKAAIAAAGGLSSLAWPDRCTVYRRLGQREQMIQVDLDRIFAGKDADFLIRRSDIINVGTHPFAPFLRRARELSLPNPVSNVGYSFTYARNYADIDSFSVRQNPHNEPDLFPRLFP